MKIFTKESAAFIVLAFIIWTILSILISYSVSARQRRPCTAGRIRRTKTDAASESKTSLLALPNRKEEKTEGVIKKGSEVIPRTFHKRL